MTQSSMPPVAVEPSSPPMTAHAKPGPAMGAGDVAFARVAALEGQLHGIDEVPLAEAASRFDTVHAELQAALTDLDSA